MRHLKPHLNYLGYFILILESSYLSKLFYENNFVSSIIVIFFSLKTHSFM